MKKQYGNLMNKWIELNHCKGLSLKKIAEKYNVSHHTVQRYFKDAKIEVKYISEDETKQAIKLLKQNYSQREVSRLTGLSRHTIRKIGKEINIEYMKITKHTIEDEDYFDKIDTHEKAYWLGFIYADGCIVYNKSRKWYRIAFNLAEKDHQQLEKFKSAIGSTAKIRKNKNENNNGLHLEISSEKMFKDLLKQGVSERKTLTVTFPKNLNSDFYNSFILGYFDGDGCIYQNKNIKKMVQFDLTGTKEFLTAIQNIMISSLELKTTKLRKCNNVYRMVYTGRRQIKKINEWLYKDIKKEMPLTRKKEIFELINSEI